MKLVRPDIVTFPRKEISYYGLYRSWEVGVRVPMLAIVVPLGGPYLHMRVGGGHGSKDEIR